MPEDQPPVPPSPRPASPRRVDAELFAARARQQATIMEASVTESHSVETQTDSPPPIKPPAFYSPSGHPVPQLAKSPKSPSLAARHDALEPDAFDAYDALGAYANKGPVPALPPSSMQRSATTSKHSSSFPVRRESPRVMWSEDVEEPPSAVRERERERARSASPRMERGGYSPRWRSPNRLERPEVHDVVRRDEYEVLPPGSRPEPRRESNSPRWSSPSPRRLSSPRSVSPSPRMFTPSPEGPRASPRSPLPAESPRMTMTPRSSASDPASIPIEFNIFFQNSKCAAMAPRLSEMAAKNSLPEEIYFYLRVSMYSCGYPLPKEYPEHQYLHRATVYAGHEAAGPAIQMRFNPATVIGLQPHHMVKGRCPMQLVLVVPVSRRVNPTVAPAQLTFQPSTSSQLHNSIHLPRIIVPVMPLGISGQGSRFSTTFLKNSRRMAIKALMCPWESSPRGQRLFIAIMRWKKVCDAIYVEKPSQDAQKHDLMNATVGTPYSFGQWFPRAALDVPSYTTIYFQNARISYTSPKPKHLPSKHLLPKEIYFYVKTKTAEVTFPLPEHEYPSRQYLHCAKIVPGHEAGGPTAHMVWSVQTVVGLKKHHCMPNGQPHRSIQMMVVVPSTLTVNPGVDPAQLAFSPYNFAQLHLSRRLPRIIVPLFPRPSANDQSRLVDGILSGRKLMQLKMLLGNWANMPGREVKRAGFCRWWRLCKVELPDLKGPRGPEATIGSPFVELLPDRGVHVNQARWPKLERAQHLFQTTPRRMIESPRPAAGTPGDKEERARKREAEAARINNLLTDPSERGRSPSPRPGSPRPPSPRQPPSPRPWEQSAKPWGGRDSPRPWAHEELEKLSMDTKAFIEKGGGDSFLSRAEPVLTKKQMFERQSSPRGSVASSTSSRAHMRGSQSSPRLYV